MYIEKEMMVMFIYDLENSDDEDSILSSILYFHPNWVSDQHRSLVCNQIVGTMQFLKDTFEEPTMLALQSGKFSVHHYGNYILALGSDRNIPDWVLEHRMNNLRSLISFYHNNIETIALKFENKTQLSEKLYSTFETYAKVLQYSGNMFTNIPTWLLPKSASNIFLEAMLILQAGQELAHVLGGSLLYHNKVIATQLNSKMTRRLIISDPYRIQSSAETVNVKYLLPEGVQMLEVYLSYEELSDLESKKKNILIDFPSPEEQPKVLQKDESKSEPIVETPLVSLMKRDRSLIFTTLHEEEPQDVSLTPEASNAKKKIESINLHEKTENIPIKRPKNLNLRLKLTSLKETETDIASTSSSLSTSCLVQTSVCQTPIGNKVLHDNVLSICSNFEESYAENESASKVKELENLMTDLNVVNSPEGKAFKKISVSLLDLRSKENLDDIVYENDISKTITDPAYPIFHPNGKLLMSSLMHKTLLGRHLRLLNAEIQKENKEKVDTWKKQFLIEKRKKQKKEKLIASFNVNAEVRRNRDMRRLSLNLPLRPFTPLTIGSTPKKEINEYPESMSNHCLTPLIPNKCFPEYIPINTKKVLNHRRFSLAKNFTYNPVGLSKIAMKSAENTNKNEFTKCILFICGFKDIVIAFVLQEEAKFCQDLIHKLAKLCNENFHLLETQLVQCFSMHRNNTTTLNETEPYSFISVDLEWDSVQRGGPWGVTELGTLTHLHRDFEEFKNITEITVKNDESVIYGNMCGKTEVFYQQCSPYNAGLPNPADIMATVSLKARRRLERDHSIILL